MDLISSLVGALALPFLLFVPGYVAARALWRDASALTPGERVFIPIALSVLLSTWFALVLAELGRFSLPLLVALVALFSAAVPLIRRKRLAAWPLRDARPDPIFAAVMALAALLVAVPAQSILGNTDSGVYINMGINIARHGGIASHDPIVTALSSDVGRQFFLPLTNPYMLYTQLRLAGFFIADAASGLILPQFLHFYPAFLAIFDSALGVRLGLYATPLLMLLASAAAYLIARTLLGRNLARLALLLLVIDVPQFWFGRYPVSEMMMQFLILTGMYAFLRSRGLSLGGRDEGAPGAGLPVLAGFAFAAVFFTRADSILLLAPLGLYFLAVVLFRLWRSEHTWFFGAFGLVFVHALVHMWVFSPDYVYFQYVHFLRMKNIDKLIVRLFGGAGLPSAADFVHNPTWLEPLIALAVVGIVLLWLVDRVVQLIRRRWSKSLAGSAGRADRPLRVFAMVALAAFFVFAYLIWPRPESPLTFVMGPVTASRAGNLIKLGWYLSPFGLGLALLGALAVLWRGLDRHTVLFYGTGALFSFFYLEELYSNPHYIYTTRHYIPLVIPLLILLAARGLGLMWNDLGRFRPALARGGRFAAAGVLALWLAYNTYAMGLIDGSRADGLALRLPFVAQSTRLGPIRLDPLSSSITGFAELGGAIDQLDALNRQIDPNAVVLLVNNRDEPGILAAPLYFLFDRDALVVITNNPAEDKIAAQITQWRAQGRPIFMLYGVNGGKLALQDSSLEPVSRFSLDVPQWQFSYDTMPRGAWHIQLEFGVYRLLPGAPQVRYPYTVDFGGDDFPATAGGFLQRASGTPARPMGHEATLKTPRKSVASASGRLRLPLVGNGPTLYLTLTARAPAAGARLVLKSGQATVGEAKLTTEFATYTFRIPRSNLQADGNSFVLDLTSTPAAAKDGQMIGAEFQRAVISDQPITAGQ